MGCAISPYSRTNITENSIRNTNSGSSEVSSIHVNKIPYRNSAKPTIPPDSYTYNANKSSLETLYNNDPQIAKTKGQSNPDHENKINPNLQSQNYGSNSTKLEPISNTLQIKSLPISDQQKVSNNQINAKPEAEKKNDNNKLQSTIDNTSMLEKQEIKKTEDKVATSQKYLENPEAKEIIPLIAEDKLELERFKEIRKEFAVEPKHIHEIVFNNDGTITKYSSPNEVNIYNHIFTKANTQYSTENERLSVFIPKIIHVDPKYDRPNIKLIDLAFGFRFCSYLVIKMGNKTYAPNDPEEIKSLLSKIDNSSTTSQYGFRIIALTTKDKNGKFDIMITSHTGDYSRITYEHIPSLIKKFLCANNRTEINKEALLYFSDFLSKLLSFFENDNKRIFINSDLLFVLSNMNNKFEVKMIDFHKVFDCSQYNQKKDEGYIFGLKNLIKIFSYLLNKSNTNITPEIAGGHVNNFIFNPDGSIDKKTTKGEGDFIKSLLVNDPSYKYYFENEQIKRFIPQYLKVYEKEGKTFLKMENISFGLTHPSIMDIKMGTKTYGPDYPEAKKLSHMENDKITTTSSLGLKINGINVKDSKGNTCMKENKKDIKAEEIPLIIQNFLKANDSKSINYEALDYFIKECTEMYHFFDQMSSRCFVALSLLFVISNIDNKFKVKFIDFSHVYPAEELNQKKDEGMLLGLKNLIQIFTQLLNQK